MNWITKKLSYLSEKIKTVIKKRPTKEEIESERNVWARHPSRSDVHGMTICTTCQSPAPAGEMALWGHCGFCRRKEIANRSN